MNCPKCYEPLRIAERQGVEIDYCPECRGVWLDKGELDKILERTMQAESFREGPDDYYSSRERARRDPYDKDHHKKKYKKKHILKEILDIFD